MFSSNQEDDNLVNTGFSLPIKQAIGFSGGIAAIVLLHIVGFIPMISIIGGISTYGALLLLLPQRKDASEIVISAGMDLESLQEILAKAKVHVQELRSLGSDTKEYGEDKVVQAINAAQNSMNRDDKVAANRFIVSQICDISSSIIKEIERIPTRFSLASAFFTDHLPRVLKVAQQGDRLGSSSHNVENNRALGVATSALLSARKGFEMQLQALVENDTRALEASASSLTRLLQIEHGYQVVSETTRKEKSDESS